MKTTKIVIALGFITIFLISSCYSPIALGTSLNLEGPEINFTAPAPRKAVASSFLLEGTVVDNTGIGRMLVKVEKDREPMPRQWRCSGGKWEISDDYGANWNSLTGAVWEGGGKSVIWSLPIDMSLNGKQPEDGEYLFSAQAWGTNNNSDDKSFKTIVLVIDNDPPIVSVDDPFLYSRYVGYDSTTDTFDDDELEQLRALADWRDPAMIGKFQTNSFQLQWNIEDNYNIWSFDLRFYKMDIEIDSVPETPLPDDYIYRVYQNTPPIPDNPDPENFVKPNGKITVPALDEEPGSYGANGELRKKITEKTTIRVVAVCYDAANNPTQEKTLGYFIYWPQADIPWITFSGDLQTPEYYDAIPGDFDIALEDAFMIYPGREIKAGAFHSQGVKEVRFSLYSLEAQTTLADSDIQLWPEYDNIIKGNPPRSANNYSTSFSWSLTPPPRSAFYIVEAKAFSVSGKESETYKAVFKVQDISFPDFPVQVSPPALEPLFVYIDTLNDSITIEGHVSDATEIDSLCLAWINPQSKDFAARSQLQYYRDSNYAGWITALGLVPNGAFATEGTLDSTYPNKVWRLELSLFDDINYPSGDAYYAKGFPGGVNPETTRLHYRYSMEIPLGDLNIGIGKQPLKSQVFLLRAENPSPKTTVITYTPQGDESPPEIKITNVALSNHAELLEPGQFGLIDKFQNNDTIAINGTWKEDSVEFLDFANYLKGNFAISINQIVIPAANITFTGTANSKSGTWHATATVGITPDITTGILNDTLVVAARLQDIGGNVSENGASWLIQSDTLRLVRISSGMPDQDYNAGKAIEIFLEFNKPVNLKSERSGDPVLTLNVVGGTVSTAHYKAGQTAQNTRQYFVYNVQNGQNTTPPGSWLDVDGLNGLAGGNYWEAANYPFTWESGYSSDNREEIRITMAAGHLEGTPGTNGNYLLRRLPVAANAADAMFTLAKGKNIGIDTAAPAVSTIRTSNAAGDYAAGAEIYINVTFTKDVAINDANPPQLVLAVNNGASTTVTTDGSVKVNGSVATFSYKVKANDTSRDNRVIVNSFTGGSVTDIAGTTMLPMSLLPGDRTLNGGSANTGTGIYINATAPPTPRFRVFSNSTGTVISNTVGGSTVTGNSDTGTVNLQNVYNDNVWFAIESKSNSATEKYQLESLEYSLDSGTNWKRIDSITGTPFKQDIYGKYTVITRQIDRAGNISPSSNAVSFNWDPGALVTRIDSTTPNGTYTNNAGARMDTVNITVYFRKPLTFADNQNQTITLNARRGGAANVTVTDTFTGTLSQLSFMFPIAPNDNTPADTGGRTSYLDVTALSMTATDAEGVTVNNYINPPTDNDSKLGYRKDILVQTGALTVSNGPAYAITQAGDECSGTITLTFNRPITKRGGNVTITQQTAGYRLPAVLTEAQSNRYKSARNFNGFYLRGTNGFVNGAPDTSTKFVLSYDQTTVVTPNTSGTQIQRLAYDFLQAENVTLPVSSQDITVSGNTLTINLAGSNALQVLGAVYDIVIPIGFVQDSLSFQWPATSNQTYSTTSPGINRPFVRVDKKVNEDRINPAAGSMTMPYLLADYSRVIQTRARLDCRTPNSVVRYNATGQQHFADKATTYYHTKAPWDGTGDDPNNPANTNPPDLPPIPGDDPTNPYYGTTYAPYYRPPFIGNNPASRWRNGDALNIAPLNEADRVDYLTQPALSAAGTTESVYSNFTGGTGTATHILVGDAAEEGYIWRISTRSRNSPTGLVNSDIFEEIAFRTVLTYEVEGIKFLNTNFGLRILEDGDQLWIRGGDAVGSSSVSGFPINWQDDYGRLNSENKRAGIRLLQLKVSDAANFNTHSVWRYITWEINVRTWHDVVLGRGNNTPQNPDEAWQYGPQRWAYQTGGWTPFKNDYTLFPGKHRWMRMTGFMYDPGSNVIFTEEFRIRNNQAVSLPQPGP
jgi:hypothetical protein